MKHFVSYILFHLYDLIMNPFLIKGYVSPEYYCDRGNESKRLVSSIKNQRDVTLFSIRKMGKTALVHHVFHQLKKSDNNVFTFYIDIMPTANLKEFINSLATAIVGTMDSKPHKILKGVQQFLKKLRPQITYDAITGDPSVSINIQSEAEANTTINEIFNYLKKQSDQQKIIIAIDEFQQILSYPEKNVEALLRKNIQQLNNVGFIFSGSQTHTLFSMFGDSKRPFYQSTELLHLERILKAEYLQFIQNHFIGKKVNISKEVIEYLLDLTRSHTFYVQFICNRLYSESVKRIKKEDVQYALLNILLENEALYYNYRSLLTEHQWKLVKAIAKEEGIDEVTSGRFIKENNLNNHSTVRRGIQALLDKEMIYKENEGYYVYDLFFSKWLERQK